MFITPQILSEYRENGVVCVRNVFNEYWINEVTNGIERNLKNPSKFSEKLFNENDSGVYFNDYCNWRNIDEFKEYVYNSPAAKIAATLMDSSCAAFYHEHVLVKHANTSRETPWHQDQSYYPFDGFKVCSIWMPVDAVPIETCVQFACGSHLEGKWYYPKKFATTLNYEIINKQKEKIYYDVPQNESIYKSYKILKFDVKPGDCVVFHMKTLHGAPGNASKTTSRRILSTRWFGDDVVLASRPWQTSPPITGGLEIGQNVSYSDEFPVVCRKNNESI